MRMQPFVALFLAVFTLNPTLATANEEGIVIDSEGNYVVSSWGEDVDGNQVWRRVVFVPGNKVNPSVKSKVGSGSKDTVEYRYQVKSEHDSRQHLVSLAFPTVNILTYLPAEKGWDVTKPGWDANISWDMVSQLDLERLDKSVSAPEGWKGTVNVKFGKTGYRVTWSRIRDGLAPAQAKSGFAFQSLELPGIGIIRLRGSKPAGQGYPDAGPEQPLYDKVHEYLDPDSDYQSVPHPVAMPRIPVPVPFSIVPALTSLREHVRDDMMKLKQIDPAFVTELSLWFDTAIAGAKGGNSASVKNALRELRFRIGSTHKELDKNTDSFDDGNWDGKHRLTKLAAKVLLFDLKAIEERAGLLGHN